MPEFQERPDSIVASVNDGGVIKINDMVMGPRMMCNSRAFCRSFFVPPMCLAEKKHEP